MLTEDTNWEEVRELVTESYRILPLKKLTAARLTTSTVEVAVASA